MFNSPDRSRHSVEEGSTTHSANVLESSQRSKTSAIGETQVERERRSAEMNSIRSVSTSNSARISRRSLVAFSVDKLHDYHDDGEDDALSWFMAACLTANYISVGFILVPWAFAQAGILLASIAFLLVMLQAFITSNFVMESCARAELLASHFRNQGDQDHSSTFSLSGFTSSHFNQQLWQHSDFASSTSLDRPEDASDHADVTSVTQNDLGQTSRTQGMDSSDLDPPTVTMTNKSSLPGIRNRKFELPQLSQIFLGKVWAALFTITTCLDLYGLTWSVSAVFASSLAADFSIFASIDDYFSFILIFAVIVVPLSFVPIVAQVWIQVLFFCGRLIMVVIMLLTTCAAFASPVPHFGNQDGPQGVSTLANFRLLHIAIQICVFSSANQFSVPVIASISKDKSKMNLVYGASSAFLSISVLILSSVLASYFGPDLLSKSSNVNWVTYHGGTGYFDEESGQQVDVAWWAIVLSKYVVLFPVIDSISTFVLCSVSLGEIILGACYGDAIHDDPPSWKHQLVFRLFGLIPQMIGATFVRDLSVIANYTGLFTILSYTICPCLLQVYSARLLKSTNLETKTRYRTMFSNEVTAWTLVFLGVVIMCYAIAGSIAIGT